MNAPLLPSGVPNLCLNGLPINLGWWNTDRRFSGGCRGARSCGPQTGMAPERAGSTRAAGRALAAEAGQASRRTVALRLACLDAARGELDTDGRLGLEAELVAGEARQQVALSDAAVADEDHLEEVVVAAAAARDGTPLSSRNVPRRAARAHPALLGPPARGEACVWPRQRRAQAGRAQRRAPGATLGVRRAATAPKEHKRTAPRSSAAAHSSRARTRRRACAPWRLCALAKAGRGAQGTASTQRRDRSPSRVTGLPRPTADWRAGQARKRGYGRRAVCRTMTWQQKGAARRVQCRRRGM